MKNLDVRPGPAVWYIGDSTTDTITAKAAGVTNIFFNGAHWDKEWLDKIFPVTLKHPHKPDAIVDDFMKFMQLVESCIDLRES